jgi:hypothetical protein
MKRVNWWDAHGFFVLVGLIALCLVVIGGTIYYGRTHPHPYRISCNEVVEQAEYRDSHLQIVTRPMEPSDVPRTIIVPYRSWWEVRFPLQITEQRCPSSSF